MLIVFWWCKYIFRELIVSFVSLILFKHIPENYWINFLLWETILHFIIIIEILYIMFYLEIHFIYKIIWEKLYTFFIFFKIMSITHEICFIYRFLSYSARFYMYIFFYSYVLRVCAVCPTIEHHQFFFCSINS